MSKNNSNFNLEDYEKELLDFYSNKLDSQKTITVRTDERGLVQINRQIRQSPIREHLKAARDLGTVTATRFRKLIGMLENPDTEVQKLAEGIILGLKI